MYRKGMKQGEGCALTVLCDYVSELTHMDNDNAHIFVRKKIEMSLFNHQTHCSNLVYQPVLCVREKD